jgi:outer membrane protein TolC
MKKILALLLTAPILGGCVDAPTTTPQLTEVAPQTLGLGTLPAPQFPDQWWKAFGDPQVDRLADAMVAGNPTLAAAIARIRAASAQYAVTASQDLPQVSLDGQEQRTLFSHDYIIPPPYGGSWRCPAPSPRPMSASISIMSMAISRRKPSPSAKAF